MVMEQTCCCGIGEFDGLTEPEDNFQDLYDELFGEIDRLKNIYIFTDAVKNGNGERMAKFIVKNKLGTIQASKAKMNPNTLRTVKLWIYYPSKKGLKAYFKKQSHDV